MAPLRASMSLAVGTRPSSSPRSRSSFRSSSWVANRRGTSPASRLARFHDLKCSMTVCGWTVVPGSASNSRIVGDLPSRFAHARSSSRMCSSLYRLRIPAWNCSSSSRSMPSIARYTVLRLMKAPLARRAGSQLIAYVPATASERPRPASPSNSDSGRPPIGFRRMIPFSAKVAAARAAAGLSRRAGAGGGTSLPGKLLLGMDPDAVTRLSGRLSGGVLALSATNGKTTTAKMLASMLEPEHRLCRNGAGANLASGVASALIGCRGADMGVFEVDEAALEVVAPALAPRVLGLGNLFRDQLDRYGELELVAARWRRISDGPWRLVRNADDPLVAALPATAGSLSYGIDDPGVALPELPHAADSKWCAACGERLHYDAVYLGHLGAWRCPACGSARPSLDVAATSVVFDGLAGTDITLSTPLGERRVRMPLPGLYNVYNALAAAAMACAAGDVPLERMAAGLEVFGPAFGRFERVATGGGEAVL